ncbi:hypothetical protein GO491_09495 [Flavobacteriaceae bacterium Ap0902]|nr:hypothetical protein [Flavobacteriaceae bacterium Ap0902]
MFTLSFILMTVSIQAQVAVSSQSNYNKLRVGGGIGLNFGSNSYFGFNISPFVGYALAPQLEAGLTAGYQYGKSDYQKSNLFSGGPYVNYYAFPSLFIRGHYEYYTGDLEYRNTGNSFSFDESALWIGGGYQSTGSVRFQTGIMYNVLYNEDDSIFSSGIRPFGGVVVSL